MIPKVIPTPAVMMETGHSFASNAKSGDVFALVGTLGTGKTHWSKGFISQIDPEATVTSPTFSIVNEYHGGRLSVYHFDLYRLKSDEELLALGWDEYLDQNGVIICEWADLFPSLLPDNAIWLEITHQPDGSRKISKIERPVEPTDL
ncbi:tRNA (adenosine(37)-N6)-threonylcarbamoyltransferase complex ATPase subunit type 1 TsaE [Luteolibacter algae]|uniref:tRNA threonylcarbamoyladenosine biosynthesis protein TsaE n=1 Tax=Luteolibacter algae TaxID=454151 RepID=A0ABW5DAB6_9BACT